MRKLKFDIYIGKNMVSGQSESIVSIVIPKFYIPKSKYNVDGTPQQISDMICFKEVYNMGTYFVDLFDLVEDANLIQATIYNNKLSEHKSLKGVDIVDYINKIEKDVNGVK